MQLSVHALSKTLCIYTNFMIQVLLSMGVLHMCIHKVLGVDCQSILQQISS